MHHTRYPSRITLRRPVAIALIALLAVAALVGCTDQSRTAPPLSQQPPPSGMPNSEPLRPPLPVDAAYQSSVEDTVAARLHSTTAAVARQLRAQRNSTLMNLAKPLGFAQDQLSAAIATGFKKATADAARRHRLTQMQASQLAQFWNAQQDAGLITEASYWFLNDNVASG